MREAFRMNLTRRRAFDVTIDPAEAVALALIAAVVASWAGVAAGAFSFLTLLSCEILFFSFYLTGSWVAAMPVVAQGLLFDLPLRLLVGYGLVNSALLVLAWVSPLGMRVNFALCLLLLCVLIFLSSRISLKRGSRVCLWLVGVGLLATTLWCRDSIDPTEARQGYVLFKPWVDGFYHAIHVRIFADSHGAATIEDFRMAQVPARLYHYGIYMLPATIKAFAGLHSYVAFAGILVPTGVLMTGFAAYAFFGSLWGAWPGIAAASALWLLPDGAQQGMQNQFMSYHWLTHISPSATYGLSLLSVAWTFVLKGCLKQSLSQVAVGWLFALLLLAYKFHFFVASALLLLLVPALFYRGKWGLRRRLLGAGSALMLYAVALAVGQRIPGVPPIRLDGSGNGEILRLIVSFVRPGSIKEFLVSHAGRGFPWTANLFYGVPYVLVTTLGFSLLAWIALSFLLRKRIGRLELVFPWLLVANFLILFFGLALDMESSTPDELSHRPLMIVYFFVTAWVGGGAALLVSKFKRAAPFRSHIIIGISTLALMVPAAFGPGVQWMWTMPKNSPVGVPDSILDVAAFLRTHGNERDVFQDSQFDRAYVISAMSERRSFVSHTMTRMPFRGEMVAARTSAVNRLMLLELGKLATATARAYGVRWFVLHRGNRVNWPKSMAQSPAFESGPVRVYEF